MTQGPQEYDAPTRAEQPPTSNQDIDYPGPQDTTPVAETPDWSHDNPIPVYLVERPQTPQVQDWSGLRVSVTANAVELVGARRNRTRCVIQNEGTNEVYLRPTMDVNTTGLDMAIPANGSVEMLHNGSVWAKCSTGESATVNILQEYTVELDNPYA